MKRDLLMFAVVIFVVLSFWRNNFLVTVLLGGEALVALAFFYNNKERLFFLIAGFFGVILEIIGGLIGIWVYKFPSLLTVPAWIFFCWGFTFILLNSLLQLLVMKLKIKESKNE